MRQLFHNLHNLRVLLLFIISYILPSLQGGAGGGSLLYAQEVSLTVTPVQQVLPPQAGQYLDNPGKFFTIRLTNNTDEEQLLHLGMHLDMLYPDEQVMLITPTTTIPRQPIVLSPRQSKLLNPVEMKQLFVHFRFNEVYIRPGLFMDAEKGIFGLLPEGTYRLFMQAYRWDPDLMSPQQVNLPDDGMCQFKICYTAQAPQFLTPQASIDPVDPLSMLSVAKLAYDGIHTFTWTAPTLNCNPSLANFSYDVKVVKLDQLTPDEAIERNPVVYQRQKLSTTSLVIPDAYLTKMKQDSAAVYAMQVTATAGQVQNPLNYTLIENDGKSQVLLFRFFDPNAKPQVPAGDDGDVSASVTGNDALDGDSLYVFEQPTLTAPQFKEKFSRKVFSGDSIPIAWRKAWYSSGRGLKQDTVKFKYTVQLFRGNSVDEPATIFKTKPVYENTVEELKDTIKWDKIKDKVFTGDYLVLRVIAKSPNTESLRMLPDSLNYVDFAMAEHFDEYYACGRSTENIENKVPVEEIPKAGTRLYIGSWVLEVNGDLKQDKETKGLSGTGFIHWGPGKMSVRVAVKFEKLMVNTDNVVFDGVCNTYEKDKSKEKEYSASEAVDELFSSWGLDNIYGNLGLPKDVAEKVNNKVGNVCEQYELGKYYTYFKNAEKQWDKWKEGNVLDLYFPTEMPKEIADKLPEDFSLQIASMMFTPKAAVMNVIGEFVLPKSDVIKNEVLIFGAPRLCISPERFLPEDGTLCLLSNFTIQDPNSDFTMAFKAPSDPMQPNNGCFLQWEDDKFGGLGLEIAMTIPGLKRVINGKAQDEPPVVDLSAVIDKGWEDWIGSIKMDAFEAEDLPGWIFTPGGTMIFDHHYEANHVEMPDISKLPKTFDPSKCGTFVKNDWKAWQGVYISKIGVQFPKWAVFGSGEQGFEVAAENMIFDPSGATLDIATYNLLEAKTGNAGGWEFDLDQAKVMITQNNFDSCHIEGRFAIPLFGKTTTKKGKEEKQKVKFECDIRHLTDGTTTYYTYNKDGEREKHTKATYGDKTRLAYILRVQQIDSLNMDCFIADVELDHDQTYFVLAAEDQPDGKTITHVELCMAGDITIAGVNKLEELGKKINLDVDLPDIHFAKMRLSNFSRDKQNDKDNMIYRYANKLTADRQDAEAKWEKDHAKRMVLFENKEMKLTEKCFLDMGEWSLASAAKKLGPFSFNLKKFNFNYSNKKLTLGIEGMVGLCDDKVSVGAGIDISSNLTIPKDVTNLSGYSLSDGDISFRSLELDLDFSILHMNGRLDITDPDAVDRGFKGAIKFDIKELFAVNCSGGYFDHKEVKDKKEDRFSWGFFTVDISGKAGIRIDPIVINRIAGGFFFNCRPTCSSPPGTPAAERKYGDAVVAKGVIGISLGVGITTTAGEKTLQGDMDLNVVYDKSVNRGEGGFSTIQFQGKVKAVGGIIDAKMCLTYENTPTDRYLALDLNVEGGMNGDKIKKAMTKLEETLQTFKGNLAAEVKDFMPDAEGGLDALNSNYDNKSTDRDTSKELNQSAAGKVDTKEKEMKAMSFTIPFNLKVTWREKSIEQTPVRWHLYLGQPDPKERVQIVLIDYKSKSGIVNVNIGANAYLCIGNELPNNGQLPPIDPLITSFLNGGKKGGVDTGADTQKAQRSRNQAVKALLPTGDNVKGGVMVGASAWGFIDVNLGLFKASLKTIAGFDMAVINYGDLAYCTNLNREMGHNGWYATGQFYAYLAARFDLHIELGKLYSGDVNLINAGIGGVFEAGLPNPTWINGQARVKLSLLGGLIDIDKKFEFACGDRCVPFKGNALDGFNLFSDFSLGSDSTAYGWGPACEVKTNDIGKAMVTTNASLGTQYRLVDPTTQADQSNRTGIDEELLDLQSSRSYIFDLDRTANYINGVYYGVNGARLFEIDASTTFGRNALDEISQWFNTHGSSFETSLEMKGASLSSEQASFDYTDPMDRERLDMMNFISNMMKYVNLGYGNGSKRKMEEKTISVRETKGRKYHLNATLNPNRYYILMMTGTAYEVENGQKVWCTYVKKQRNGKLQTVRIKWQQTKFFFFSTAKSEPVPAVVYDLQPYVAAAFPASADGKLFNTEADKEEVYECDLMRPTIALNQDIRSTTFNSGKLNWVLNSLKEGETTAFRTQTISNQYKVNGSTYVNMQPEKDFTIPAAADRENLQLTYTYKVPAKCWRNTSADKWEVMESYIKNEDNWSEFKEYMDFLMVDPNDVSTDRKLNEVAALADSWLNFTTAERKKAWNKYFTAYKQQNAACTKDTTIVLADLWFRQPELETWHRATSLYASGHYGAKLRFTDQIAVPLLPYTKPFVGVRPQNEPVFTYNGKYQANKNFDIIEGWYQLEGAQNYRLKDPFMYFAYLSQMVFLGGASLRSYGFDAVAVPHASETLTVTYNGESVQGIGIAQTDYLKSLRDRMFGVWNTWYYTNGVQEPEYPLPTGSGDLYEVTRANQDGKAGAYVSYYKKSNASYPYHLGVGDFIKDFAAPYYVAQSLSKKMQEIAQELYNYYKTKKLSYPVAIRAWNQLHRGQYLTVSSRGFEVRVPYYQFPLIFGDCFGRGPNNESSPMDPVSNNAYVADASTSFYYSVTDQSRKKMSSRWHSFTSNLFFFRLKGGYPFATNAANVYTTYGKDKYVEWDNFKADEALKQVTAFRAKLYRTQSFDLRKGLFAAWQETGAPASSSNIGKLSGTREFNPFEDRASGLYKKTLYEWIQLIGQPSVTVNSTKMKTE